MKIKTIQWNIGGGKIRKANSDPLSGESYKDDGILHIKEVLKKYNPDIIFLQEMHHSKDFNQVKALADSLKLEHYLIDTYDHSHIEKGQELGQAIISKFSIKDHKFKLFLNPKFEIIRPNGEKWISHDKGISSCIAEIDKNTTIHLKTLHFIPFRRFNIDPLSDILAKLKEDIADKIKCDNEKFLLQGDFNYDDFSLKKFLPEIFSNNVQEVILNEVTTVDGKKYDHIIYKGLKHLLLKVDPSVLTDHFPVYSEFEI